MPAVTPATVPVDEPIVALPLLLLQVPPPASVKFVVDPAHTLLAPVIDDGNGFTVITIELMQPVAVKV